MGQAKKKSTGSTKKAKAKVKPKSKSKNKAVYAAAGTKKDAYLILMKS